MFPRKIFPAEPRRTQGLLGKSEPFHSFSKLKQVELTTFAKKIFLSRYLNGMSLQFDVEEFIRPLVSALYESSDEGMEIDTASTTVVNQSLDDDSDIEVIACYRETPIYPPQLAAGRAMTFEDPSYVDDQPYLPWGPPGSTARLLTPRIA